MTMVALESGTSDGQGDWGVFIAFKSCKYLYVSVCVIPRIDIVLTWPLWHSLVAGNVGTDQPGAHYNKGM